MGKRVVYFCYLRQPVSTLGLLVLAARGSKLYSFVKKAFENSEFLYAGIIWLPLRRLLSGAGYEIIVPDWLPELELFVRIAV